MAAFKSTDEMYSVFGQALEEAFQMEKVARAMGEAGLAMQFIYTGPLGSLTVDCRSLPIKWELGEKLDAPDVTFRLLGETAHRFFLGELNVPAAIATRQIVFKGNVAKALKLLPAMKPVYAVYREALKKMGRADLLGQAAASAPAQKAAPKREKKLMGLFTVKRPAAIDYEAVEKLYRVGPAETYSGAPPAPAKKRVFPPLEGPPLFKKMLETMLLIRKFEEHLADAFAEGRLPTFAVHLSIGQEAIAAGACLALRADDIINTTHRGHGHLLAKGADLNAMMAELYGKSSGTCKGKGGSMHVIDRRVGIMGSNGIVGAGIVLGAGAALAADALKDGRVSVVFFGDGATNQGMFHEGLNFAAVKKLPAVFIVENNLYGEFTPLSEHAAETRLSERAKAYGIEGVRTDGNDARSVHWAVAEAAEKARNGGGPTLIECMTYRWRGHMEDDGEEYRTEDEKEKWKENCPILRLKGELESEGVITARDYDDMLRAAQDAVEAAAKRAEKAAEPKPQALYENIYAPDPKECYEGALLPPPGAAEMTVSQAINETLAAEMRRDPKVILMGEDVALGGYFSVTRGLVEEFGKKRVIDTPISENAIVGGGVGAAAEGLRPVVEILFTDFITCCLDPIVNQAAKLHYMSGGQVEVPLTIRMPSGGGVGMAAQHSQSLETMLVGVPGLIVVAPSDAHTAAGLLRSAIRSQNPVVFVEHKLMYLEVGAVAPGAPTVPLRKTRIAREGRDVTIVTYSYGFSRCREAADKLAREGIEAEIVDLLTLYSLDIEPVLRSIQKTGHLLVVEEGTLTLGIGAEVLARVAECAWGALKTAPRRLAGKEVPTAYAKSLETLVAPTPDDIVGECARMLGI